MFGAKTLFINFQCSAIEGFRLGKPICVVKQHCQIDNAVGDKWMVGAKAPLVDGEGATIVLLSLSK
jgi:hypothetical protein